MGVPLPITLGESKIQNHPKDTSEWGAPVTVFVVFLNHLLRKQGIYFCHYRFQTQALRVMYLYRLYARMKCCTLAFPFLLSPLSLLFPVA